MITAASDQRACDALCDALSDEPREDICPTCGIECECRGPYESIAPALIRAASPLSTLTPAVSYEADTVVVDVADHLSAITAKLSQHIKDDAAVSEIVDMVLAYRRAG